MGKPVRTVSMSFSLPSVFTCLKFERKWWHGPILNCHAVGKTGGIATWMGKPLNIEV